jgi:hypothetical protein
MKHICSALCLALAFAVALPDAQAAGGPRNKTFGLGLALGSPTGITGKVFFNDVAALSFGLGFAWPFGGFGAWVDGNFHFVKFRHKREDVLKMSLYAGPGIQLAFAGYWYTGVAWYQNSPYYVAAPGPYYYGGYVGGPFSVAIRGPFGFAIHWQKVSFDTFVEVGPAIYIVFTNPVTVFPAPLASVGARYYF